VTNTKTAAVLLTRMSTC